MSSIKRGGYINEFIEAIDTDYTYNIYVIKVEEYDFKEYETLIVNLKDINVDLNIEDEELKLYHKEQYIGSIGIYLWEIKIGEYSNNPKEKECYIKLWV